MAKISVLVPIYNVEMYLEQCLDSLCNQNFQDFEIICADDGSTDSSGTIIDRYAAKDSRIKVIHKVNTGYGNNMNVALEAAGGEYIAILESDDFAEPDMLEKLYEAAQVSGADVVKGEYFRYREDGEEHSDRLADFPCEEVFSVKEYPHLLDLADTIWSCLYRKEFLDKHGIRFHETPGASYQDISFALQNWIHAEKVYFIPGAVLHYRMDNAGSSMNNADKLYCVFDEYQWANELFGDKWQADPVLHKYFISTKFRDYFNHYHRVAAVYQYAFLQKLSAEFVQDTENGRVSESAFLQVVWDKLMRMQKNFNQFFKDTAKETGDLRLRFCKFKNDEIYSEMFVEKMREYPQVVIYGAGKVGQWLAARLEQRDVRVTYFAVTDIGDGPGVCCGIPVKELKELCDIKNTCAVILAVAEKNQFEMYQNLNKAEFQHVFRVDPVLKKWL